MPHGKHEHPQTLQSPALSESTMVAMSDSESTLSRGSQNLRYHHGLPSNPKAFLFENSVPRDPRTIRKSLVRPEDLEGVTDHNGQVASPQNSDRLCNIFWPAVALCLPITLLSTALLILVLINRVVPQPSILDGEEHQPQDHSFLLVNFSATRLVFVSGFISTTAPLLSSFIMSLYALLASNRLKEATRTADYSALPTPFQMSLLVGVLLASLDQLREYFWYLASRKRRADISYVVHRSATIFTLVVMLASGIIVADTVLHYYTNTIEFSQIILSGRSSSFGRGLSSTCLDFNRTVYGWPCSVALGWNDPDLFEEQNENVRLAHNTSTTSSIRIANPSNLDSSLAYLLPSATSQDSSTDYIASTIGISTSCILLPPPACNMTISGPSNIYTNFTCSPNFFSTLGLTPNPSEADGIRTPDASRSFLQYKPASNLMYSFFTSPSLTDIYNTVGYNDSGQLDPNLLPYPDSALLNPFYLALAGRLPTSSFPPNSPMLSSNLTFSSSGNAYIDFILSCSVASHAVTYTSAQSSIRNLSATPHGNGSLLEIFHGSQLYTGIGNSGYDLQDYLVQSALASPSSPSIEAFTSKFSSLYSVKVLSKIGAYTTARSTLQQQERKTLLLSQVPTGALAALISLSLLYPIIGVVLMIKAWRVTNNNVQDIAQQLSLAGLSGAAFGESPYGSGSSSTHGLARMRSDLGASTGGSGGGGTESGRRKEKEAKETRRVMVGGDAETGYHFRVMGFGAP